jgi:hypothetical protein
MPSTIRPTERPVPAEQPAADQPEQRQLAERRPADLQAWAPKVLTERRSRKPPEHNWVHR